MASPGFLTRKLNVRFQSFVTISVVPVRTVENSGLICCQNMFFDIERVTDGAFFCVINM